MAKGTQARTPKTARGTPGKTGGGARKKAAALAKAKKTVSVQKKAKAAEPGALATFEEAMRQPFDTLRHEIDRVFEDFSSAFPRFPFPHRPFELEPWKAFEWPLRAALPATDVTEKETHYEVTAELPGMTENDFALTIAGGTLTISGEKSEEKEEKKKDYHLSERRYGSIRRTLPVPENVDANKIEASFKDGVLTIVLPKTKKAAAKQKKIAVKPG